MRIVCVRELLEELFYDIMQGIQITATTPTSNAIRFETGDIHMELSNRVQNVTAVNQRKKGVLSINNLCLHYNHRNWKVLFCSFV